MAELELELRVGGGVKLIALLGEGGEQATVLRGRGVVLDRAQDTLCRANTVLP